MKQEESLRGASSVRWVAFNFHFLHSHNIQNLDPGDINIKPTTTSTATTTTEEDVWDDELKEAGKKKVEIKMQESADDLQIDCWTIFDLYNPEKITGT